MGANTPDFSGWATKAGLQCSDGRTITKDAFKEQDGTRVPLVWQHGHNEIANILGHAILTNKDDGVWCDAYFNSTDMGKIGQAAVQHGDVTALSIYANKLVEKSKSVLHGVIREVSLVLAGANPGALIDPLTIERRVDGSPEDTRFREWFRQTFQLSATKQGGSSVRKNGMIVKRHNGQDVLRFAFYHAWVKSSKFTDLEAGSTSLLLQTIVLEHEGLERV